MAEIVLGVAAAAVVSAAVIGSRANSTISYANNSAAYAIHLAEARANAFVDRTVSKALTLTGKVCIFYLTLLAAGYIEMNFYQIEILQLILSHPSLLTGAVLYIQHSQTDLFYILTFITGIYFFIPALISVFTFLSNNVMLSVFAFTVVSCLVGSSSPMKE